MIKNNLRRRTSRQPIVDVNLLPFIDIILVLLVVFMVTAPLSIQGIQINLPEVSNEPIETTGKEIVITYTQQRLLYLEEAENIGQPNTNKQPLSKQQLVEQIDAFLTRQPNTTVLFRADKNLKYNDVLQLVESLEREGVPKIALITEPYSSAD